MPIPDKEKLNRIEELKSKLFSKSYETKIEYKDTFSFRKKEEVPDSWKKNEHTSAPEKIFMKTTMFKKIFLFSIVFFVLSLGYVSYMFLAGGNTVSNDNIDISVLGNSFTAGGEELPLQVEIINRNNSAIDLVDLVLEYPTGSMNGTEEETERIRESLGTIPAGGIRNENVKLILFGEQGSVREIKITLEYRVEGSNAIFIKDKIHEVSINSTPINLVLEAPTEASPNQDIILNVKATLNATRSASKVLIKLDYPVGFQFVSSKPAPSYDNNIWNLGDLAPGVEQNIFITGRMIDVFDGEEKTFHVFSGSQSKSDKTNIGVIFNSLGHTVLIRKSFVEVRLFVNGFYEKEYASNNKNAIRGEIKWVNNLETKINDVKIRAKFSGNAYDRKKIQTQDGGFYNSIEDSIIWDKNSNSNFAEVEPGESGSLAFTFVPLPIFSAKDSLMKDPMVLVEVSITGKHVIDNNILEDLSSMESKLVRIITDVGLVNKVLYYTGPLKNTGPIPPKAEQETTYTVVWTLSNTSNNVSKAQVRSTLPPQVNFLGTISPVTEDLKFDKDTKEIIWNVGGIPRGTGITGNAREVAFQISILPSLSQVGTTPTLINDTVLTGHDDFANVDVRVNKASLNTRLGSDPYFPSDGSRIVE